MGFTTAFRELVKGNFQDAFNYAWVDEDSIRDGTEAENKLTQLISEKAAAGAVSQEEANASLARIQMNAFPYIFQQPSSNPALGFVEGLNEGAENIGKFASKSISTATGITWKIIPWQVWVVLGIIAVVYAYPFIAPALAARAITGKK